MLKEAAQSRDPQEFIQRFGQLCFKDEQGSTEESVRWPIEKDARGETIYRIKLCLSGGRERYSFSIGKTRKEKGGEVVGRNYVNFDRSGRLYFGDGPLDELICRYGERVFAHPHSTTVTSYAKFPKSLVSHLAAPSAPVQSGVLEIPVQQAAFDAYVRPFMLTQEFSERFGNMIDYINAPAIAEVSQRERLIDHWKLDTRGNHPVGALIQIMRKKNLIFKVAGVLANRESIGQNKVKQYADRVGDLLQREYPATAISSHQQSQFHWKRGHELLGIRQKVGPEPFRKLAAYTSADWKRSPRDL